MKCSEGLFNLANKFVRNVTKTLRQKQIREMNIIFIERARFAKITASHCGDNHENLCCLHNYNTNFIDLVADISLFSKHELLKYFKLF